MTDFEFGEKLTYLSDSESKTYLDKYEPIIRRECGRANVPGYDFEDLCQECRIKLLSGIHGFNPDRSSEKTWTYSVIKNTIKTLHSKSLRFSRTLYLPTEDGKMKPVFEQSLDDFIGSETELTHYDTYNKKDYNSTSFSSDCYDPDELFDAKYLFDSLKEKLSPEIFDYIESKVISNNPVSSIIQIQEKYNQELEEEGFKGIQKTRPFGIFIKAFNLTKIAKKEINILLKIATVLVSECGLNPEEIMKRTKTFDLKYSPATM